MDLRGKTCLITGGTAGIGKATAAALAELGANLIIAGRDERKAQESCAQIRSVGGVGSVDYLLADFEDLDRVSAMAAAFLERHARLDILINNAGAFFARRQVTQYVVEKTLLVNHLAPFLLTRLLTDLMLDSAPARIINVSSAGHKYGTLDFDDLPLENGYSGMKAYGRSKLANILFTYELARRLEGTGVSVNAVHPGQVATDIWRKSIPIIGPIIMWYMRRFALTPEQGADTVVYAAASPEMEGVTGKYLARRRAVASSSQSYDEESARQLWHVSSELVGLA